jgi:hypothetical protein
MKRENRTSMFSIVVTQILEQLNQAAGILAH